MSSMSPEGNIAPTGGTPTGGGAGRGPGRRGNATGAASRVAVDTRDLAKMKDLLSENVKQLHALAKGLKELDPAVGSLKAVNSELDKMHQLFGLVGGAARGSSRSGGGGGVGASNQKASYTPQTGTQTGVGSGGIKSYSPQASTQSQYNFGQPAQVNLGGTGPGPGSYTQRIRSYLAQPANPYGRGQYGTMSRGMAIGAEVGGSLIGGALGFAGSYVRNNAPQIQDRSLFTNRISIAGGGTGSYSQQQGIGVAATSALSANQGFGDVTQALGSAMGVGGGGATNAVAQLGSANFISRNNPNLTGQQAVQQQNTLLSTGARNRLRSFGVRTTGLGSAGVNSQSAIDGYIRRYEQTNRHKLSSQEIESANTPGYPLYNDIMAVWGDESVIPTIVARWHQLNGTGGPKAVAGNQANNASTVAQTRNSAFGALATTANPGMVRGLNTVMRGETAVANRLAQGLKAAGSTGQDAIAGTVIAAMSLSELAGIGKVLGRIEKILIGSGGGSLVSRLLGRGGGAGGAGGGAGAGGLGTRLATGIGTMRATSVGAAGVGSIAGTVVGGLAAGYAIGTGANAVLNHFGVGSDAIGGLLNSGNEHRRDKKAINDLNAMVQRKGLMSKPGFDGGAFTKAIADGDWSSANAVVQKYILSLQTSNRSPRPSGGSAAPAAGGGGMNMQAAPPPLASNVASNVVSTASNYIGQPYRGGGDSPSSGFDCSGLIQYAYKQAGINLPGTAAEQAKVGVAVNAAQAAAGDLVFFAGNGVPGSAGHVGLYLGNGRMLESPSAGGTIRVTSANLGRAMSIRRVAGGAGALRGGGGGGIGQNPDSVLMNALKGGGMAVASGVAAGGSTGTSNSKASPSTTGTGAPGAAAAPSSSGGNVALAQKMAAALGWTGSQWNDLYAVWNQESSFKTTAGSPGHAYGIPQGNPGSVMASAGSDWQSNPATQIKWGLNYIAGRYKTPAGALAHKHQTDSNLGAKGLYAQPGGWYEQGSWNIVKDQIAALHKGEMVLPEKTANMVRTIVNGDTQRGTARGGHGRTTAPITLYYQVMTPTSEHEVRKHAQMFASVLADDHQIDLVAAGGANR